MKHPKVLFLSYLVAAIFVSFISLYVIPAFRGEIEIRSGFFLGPFHVRFYGLIVGAAILVAWVVVLRLAQKRGLPLDKIENALFWSVVFGFFGARLYYVIFSWELFKNNQAGVFRIWEGGLAIFGAVIFGCLAAWVYSKKSRLNFLLFLDLAAVALPLGQAIGRWGNFFNQEAYGRPTSLPWKMFVATDSRPSIFEHANFFHPAFLYESFWDLLVFGTLIFLFRKNPRPGLLIGNYLILYSIGRFFIQPLRIDSLMLGSARVDQITALLFMIFGILLIFYGRFNEKNPGKVF